MKNLYFLNNEGKVIRVHYKPDALDSNKKTGGILFDPDNIPPAPAVGPNISASLYFEKDGKNFVPVWKTGAKILSGDSLRLDEVRLTVKRLESMIEQIKTSGEEDAKS